MDTVVRPLILQKMWATVLLSTETLVVDLIVPSILTSKVGSIEEKLPSISSGKRGRSDVLKRRSVRLLCSILSDCFSTGCRCLVDSHQVVPLLTRDINFLLQVRYQSRKRLAEQRPRVRGQFVRQPVYDPSAVNEVAD